MLPTEQFGGAFSLVKNDINQNIEVSHRQLPKPVLDVDLVMHVHTCLLSVAEVEDPQGAGPTAVRDPVQHHR